MDEYNTVSECVKAIVGYDESKAEIREPVTVILSGKQALEYRLLKLLVNNIPEAAEILDYVIVEQGIKYIINGQHVKTLLEIEAIKGILEKDTQK